MLPRVQFREDGGYGMGQMSIGYTQCCIGFCSDCTGVGFQQRACSEVLFHGDIVPEGCCLGSSMVCASGLCHVMPCCAMLCPVMPCCAMLSMTACPLQYASCGQTWRVSYGLCHPYLKPLNQTGQLLKVKGRMREKDDVWWP